MRKAVLREPLRFELVDTDIPRIADDELLVKVRYCGICGSDLHAYAGKNQFSRFPYVPGHEFVGVVQDAGRNARFKAGQMVTVEPGIQCNRCLYCRRGDYQLCTNQASLDGAFADYAVTKAWKTFAVPPSVDAQTATLIEPLACALHAMDLAGMKKGWNVLVQGAGPIGQLLVRTARTLGAQSVAVTDLFESRLSLARQGGASAPVRVTDGYTPGRLVEEIGADVIDVVFDTIANDFSMGCGVAVVKKGGTVVVVGVPATKVCFDLGKVMYNELRVVGDLMYRDNFPTAISMVSRKKIDTQGMISRVFALAEIGEAFRQIEEGKDRFMKCLVEP
ncbi:MAG TPA: alcohol dehydrogenase catalytic domain-containing protein [Spirochaetia bacterium]|nr:alcohol dehydrogenase catalytic domain-containing protein [Spirochaetia bacterium]